MRHFDYVVFDLDGTLLDTREGVIGAAVRTMKEYKKDIPSQDILENLIGPPMQLSFKTLFGLSEEKATGMADQFRNYYKMDEYLFKAVPYEGIFDLFGKLYDAGVKIGIATYKREDYAKRLLIKAGFDKYTSYMYGSDFEGKLKKYDIIRACLADMDCNDYSKAVYIGDGKSDGKGANAVGINFIAVTYGFDFKRPEDARSFNPIGVAKNCEEIGDLIFNLNYLDT